MNGSVLTCVKLVWLIGVVNMWIILAAHEAMSAAVGSSTVSTTLSASRATTATTTSTTWATTSAVTNMPTTAMGTVVPIATMQSNMTTGDQRATAGDNVNITLSVNFTNHSAVTLSASYGSFYGSDLFTASCSINIYKCSSTNTNTSITVTIHLTNVMLYNGGVYTLTSDTGAWDNVTLTVCEPASRPVLLSSVNKSLHVLQCKMNSRCYPPCNSCWSSYTYTWYERLSPGVSEASVIDGVTSESYSLAVTEPDGRGYYCSTTVAGTGTVSSVNTFWHVCHPNDSVTCGVYGQDVSVLFVIGLMPPMNLSDSYNVQLQGVNVDSGSFSFGNPLPQSIQFGSVELVHPELTCGFIVNHPTVHDSGQYMCTISTLALASTWRVTLNQTLQLCAPSSPYITAVSESNNGSQVLVCTLAHDSRSCNVSEHYLWLINGTLSPSNINQNLTIDVEPCDSTTYACCVAWGSDACVAVSQPYVAITTVSPDLCQVSPTVVPSTGGTSNTLAIIVGVTIGGGVLLAVVIAVVLYCCIRKIKRDRDKTANGNTLYAGPGGAEIMDNEDYGSEVKQDTYAYGGGKYAYGDDGVALEVKDNYAYDSSHKTDDYGGGYGGGGMILEDNPSYGGGVPVAANTHTPAANGNKELYTAPSKTKKPGAVKPQPGESYSQVDKSQLKAKPPASPATDIYTQAKPTGKTNGATTQAKNAGN